MDSNSAFKDLLFPRGPNLAQKPWYLVGTVLNKRVLSQIKLEASKGRGNDIFLEFTMILKTIRFRSRFLLDDGKIEPIVEF